ncbi:MAG: hypothetical protein FWG84_07375 [Bacteroidales bacterium]|nr:hypothetical protein [Bacteroidales bacterium]
MKIAMDNREIMAQCWDNGWCWENAYGVDNQRIRAHMYGITDPLGIISYTYNAFGDMLTQTDARGKVTVNTYDNLRRIKTQTMTGEPPKTYDYYTSGQGKGKLESIASSQSLQSYEYGDFGRLTKMTEKLNDGQTFETQYAYDDYGNKTEITYPGGFKIKRIYNNKGYVTEIRQASNNQLIWRRLTENALGQPLTYQMGNGKTTTCQYNGYNLPTRVSIPNIQDFAYNIDSLNGNMRWRQDRTTANVKTENFDYDVLHRLTVVKQNQSAVLTTVYDNNGNILSKTDVGQLYQYDHPSKVHALTRIDSSTYILSNSGNQTVSYTAFHKADTIKNLKTNQHLIITYGVDNQRTRTRLYDENILQKTKYFATNYEKEITLKTTREINYISTPYGTLAAYIKENSGAGQLYYLYKDHLGSITAITNTAGTVLERRSFDAWGRLRNPNDWSFNGTFAMTILDRGYTGHEHLPEFGLINMNGRLYDPLIGLMLSPDPYVSMPESMQGFNRYNYCLNNPLKYTDPSGEFVHLIVGAVIGGLMNMAINARNISNGWQALGYFGIGAAVGALTAGMGNGLSVAMAGGGGTFGMGFVGNAYSIAQMGFIQGAVMGGITGFAGGLLGGAGNAWMQGDSFMKGLEKGMTAGNWGALGGAVIGGMTTGLFNGKDNRFLDGEPKPKVVHSPIASRAGTSSGTCFIEGMDAISSSFGNTDHDVSFWKNTYEICSGSEYGGATITGQVDYVEQTINSVDGYDAMKINQDKIFESMKAGNRVGVSTRMPITKVVDGGYQQVIEPHFMPVKTMKVWPNGTVKYVMMNPNGGLNYVIKTKVGFTNEITGAWSIMYIR